MIEKQLLTLCLKKDFYKEHRNKLSKSLFTNGVGNFFETIQKAHDEYDTDLSLDELIKLKYFFHFVGLTKWIDSCIAEQIPLITPKD